MSKPILGYWDIRGLGQPIRYLLKHLSLDFEDRRYKHGLGPDFNREDWLKEKFSLGLDFPNIPYWIDGDTKLTDSKAILKHLARTYGTDLVPKDPVELAKIEMLESVIMDVWDLLAIACYEYTEVLLQKLYSLQPLKLKYLSDFIGDGNWFGGDQLTYVDFLAYETLMTHQKFDKEFLEPFPNLLHFLETFENLPAIDDYLKSSEFIQAPFFTPLARHFI
ncbi:unnamed protein product [Allacma fusca]|uniref:glutathione transferase n=1 Tax=Allacma fusca TaxID=39272 RepID=A0A8J2MBF0_9HEXA|nr:unnamed protein product [Allacma fusca]